MPADFGMEEPFLGNIQARMKLRVAHVAPGQSFRACDLLDHTLRQCFQIGTCENLREEAFPKCVPRFRPEHCIANSESGAHLICITRCRQYTFVPQEFIGDWSRKLVVGVDVKATEGVHVETPRNIGLYDAPLNILESH